MKERSRRLNKARKHRSRPKFNENDPQYKCCCKRVHIRLATIVVGAVEIFGIIVITGSLIFAVADGQKMGINKDISFGLLGNGIGLALIILMGFGIKKERPVFLIPHMVGQILGIVALFLGVVLMIVALATDEHDVMSLFFDFNQFQDQALRERFVYFLIPMIVGLFIAGCLEVWFLIIVYRCYKYLNDLIHSKNNKTSDHYVQLQHVTATKPDENKNESSQGDKLKPPETDKTVPPSPNLKVKSENEEQKTKSDTEKKHHSSKTHHSSRPLKTDHKEPQQETKEHKEETPKSDETKPETPKEPSQNVPEIKLETEDATNNDEKFEKKTQFVKPQSKLEKLIHTVKTPKKDEDAPLV